SLDVDEYIYVFQLPGDFRDPVGAAGAGRVGQLHVSAKRANFVSDFARVGGHADAAGAAGSASGLVRVLENAFSRFAEKELSRKASRGQSSRDDDRAAKGWAHGKIDASKQPQ